MLKNIEIFSKDQNDKYKTHETRIMMKHGLTFKIIIFERTGNTWLFKLYS